MAQGLVPNYNEATMWGPQGDPNSPRKRLQPGDRLADGTLFKGDDPEVALLAELKRIEDLMRPLEIRRNGLLHKLSEFSPEKYGTFIEGQEGQFEGLPTQLIGFSPIGETAPPPLLTVMGRPPDPELIEAMKRQAPYLSLTPYPGGQPEVHYVGPPTGAPPPTAEQLAQWAQEDAAAGLSGLPDLIPQLRPAVGVNPLPPDLEAPGLPDPPAVLPPAPLTPAGEIAKTKAPAQRKKTKAKPKAGTTRKPAAGG